jgi:acyl carrier protein
VPRNALEEKLCRIWEEVLGLERVGIDDDFFQLGGHSLTALQVISRVQAAYGLRLQPTVMFEALTIRATAQWIEKALLAEIEDMPDEAALSVVAG